MDREKRKVDDLFSEYDFKLRSWILEKLRNDLTLYHFLISPATETENHPASLEKYMAESISNKRKFLQTLWPKKQKRGRRVEIEMDWFKAKDREEVFDRFLD